MIGYWRVRSEEWLVRWTAKEAELQAVYSRAQAHGLEGPSCASTTSRRWRARGCRRSPRNGIDRLEGRTGIAPVNATENVRTSQKLATQLAISRAPASPDFSGWNWVDHTGPSSTAATNRSPPCSAQVTRRASGRRQVAHRVRVHEVEPLVRDSSEQP